MRSAHERALMEGRIQPDLQELKKVLKNLRHPDVVGRSSLTALRGVTREVERLRIADTPTNRAFTLIKLIEDTIVDAIRDRGRTTPEGFEWAVLHLQYVEGANITAIAEDLKISARSVLRLRDAGVVRLSQSLLDIEARQPET